MRRMRQGPGFHPAEVARLPVEPGNSDLCFQWNGPIADAITHLERCRVPIHAGPIERFGARGAGTSVYFRDPTARCWNSFPITARMEIAPDDRVRPKPPANGGALQNDDADLVVMDGAARAT